MNAARLSFGRVTLDEANAFVRDFHRHHRKVVGHIFALGAFRAGALVGVVIVGRPVSRKRQDGFTLEVTRCCSDGSPNVCSFLYGKAARAAFALGYLRIGTYTLPIEGGASLRGAGWKLIGERGGGEWSSPSRPRQSAKFPTGTKLLWEAPLPEPPQTPEKRPASALDGVPGHIPPAKPTTPLGGLFSGVE